MKLLKGKNPKSYFEEAIRYSSQGIELELIFGSSPYENTITKKVYLQLINQCKEYYTFLSEESSLDIRHEYKNQPSNIRCTINGKDNIKKYCREDSLDEIESVEYMIKNYYKNNEEPTKKFIALKDMDYNVRLNIKTEKPLSPNHNFVLQFLSDFKNKKKHFRYKKRYSFITKDKLFRIDLTVVKETSYRNRRFNFQKTFKKANILRNRENYELEIEYIGTKDSQTEIPEINYLFKMISENHIRDKPNDQVIGNMYDPLNLGIHIFVEPETKMVETYEYGDETYVYDVESPRYDNEYDMVNEVSYDKFTSDKYQTLIGKYARIKDTYFEEQKIDLRVRDSLKEYYRMGKEISIIERFNDESTAVVKLEPAIGRYTYLDVPINDLYYKPHEFGEILKVTNNKVIEDEMDTPLLSVVPIVDTKNIENIHKLTTALVDILEEHVIHLTKCIYNTDTIISYDLKKEVIDGYKLLTGQKKKKDKYNNYFQFVGPQPKTLNFEHLQVNNPNSILVDYAVTEKADGESYELYITNGNGYLINAKIPNYKYKNFRHRRDHKAINKIIQIRLKKNTD